MAKSAFDRADDMSKTFGRPPIADEQFVKWFEKLFDLRVGFRRYLQDRCFLRNCPEGHLEATLPGETWHRVEKMSHWRSGRRSSAAPSL